RYIRAVPSFSSGDLFDLIEEYYAARLDSFDRNSSDLIHVSQLLLLFLNQVLHRFIDSHISYVGPSGKHVGEYVLKIDIHLLDAGVSVFFFKQKTAYDIEYKAELFSSFKSVDGRNYVPLTKEAASSIPGKYRRRYLNTDHELLKAWKELELKQDGT